MTKSEYASYLGAIIDEEIDANSKYLEDQFYGYFQSFMPYGEKLEKVFEPLPDGSALYDRIKPIYSATEEQALDLFNANASPGYFVPSEISATDDVMACAKRWLENLVVFADFVTDADLCLALQSVKNVRIGDKVDESDLQDVLWDVFSDWKNENLDSDALISVLDEAYYSIACDYFIAAYLQYPSFKNKPAIDFLAPYFELWKRGFRLQLTTTELLLIKH